MKKLLLAFLALGVSAAQAQSLGDMWNKAKEDAGKTIEDVKNAASGVTGGESGVKAPSADEIVAALKEALNQGTNASTAATSKTDGYLKNARLFIPFPPEAADMKARLVKLGMQKKVNEFETSLNRAAEEAAKTAAPVFLAAIRNMTVKDGMSILKGADTAATSYLKTATSGELYTQYKPIVKDAINKVKVTKHWNPLVKKYNKLPGVKKQNPDLDDYVTKKAIYGLFLLVADEEARIRKDPMTRATDILKSVFGWADSQKGK